MGKGSYILGKVLGCRVIPNILGKGFNIMGNGPRIMGNGSNILGTTVNVKNAQPWAIISKMPRTN